MKRALCLQILTGMYSLWAANGAANDTPGAPVRATKMEVTWTELDGGPLRIPLARPGKTPVVKVVPVGADTPDWIEGKIEAPDVNGAKPVARLQWKGEGGQRKPRPKLARYLVDVEVSGVVAERWDIQVTGQQKLLPLGDAGYSMAATRLVPFLTDWQLTDGRLRYDPTEALDFTAYRHWVGKPLAMLSNSRVLVWQGSVREANETQSVQLGLESADRWSPVESSGRIVVPGGESVKVTVMPQDWLPYPAAVLLMGVWMAWWAKRWTQSGRTLQVNRAELAEARLALKQAQEKLNATAKASGFAGRSIEKDTDREVVEIENEFQAVRRAGSVLDASNARYTAAVARVRALAQAAASWAAYGEDLRQMVDALAELKTTFKERPEGVLHDRPVLETEAKKVLDSTADVALASLPQLRTNAGTRTDQMKRWSAAWSDAELLRTKFGREHPEIAAKAKEAERLLWDEIAEEKFQAAVKAIEEGKAAIGKALSQEGFGREGVTGRVPGEAAAEKVLALNLALLRGDAFNFVVAAVLALVTGLNQFYFGKAFGSLGDYAKLLALGLGMKVAVDAVSAGLEKLLPVTEPQKDNLMRRA